MQEENDSLRCQLEAMRNEMSLERTDSKYDRDFCEKQIKVLQETIRNMQTYLMQTKLKEQKDSKTIEQLEHKLKESAVKQLLLKTKIRQTTDKLKEQENSSRNSETSELVVDETEIEDDEEKLTATEKEFKHKNKVKSENSEKNEFKQQTEEANIKNNVQQRTKCINVDIIQDDIEIVEVMKVPEMKELNANYSSNEIHSINEVSFLTLKNEKTETKS